MSADAVAAPLLSLNVRHKRNVQETSEEESQVEILEEEEHHTDLGPQRARPHTQNNPAANNRRSLKAAAATLGGFFFLILAGLFIYFTLLQTRYDQLSNIYSQLQDEAKQLKNRTKFTVLQIRYDQLSNNYTQLQNEIKRLKDRTEDKICPDGWRFGCSCYFKSKEKKTWEDSRADCQQRGADLVVIDNEEEHKFISKLSKDGESWIGILDSNLRWSSQWVDGSSKWIRVHGIDNLKTWICEKKFN